MPAEPPAACSLTATDLRLRVAEAADLGRAALVDARSTPTSAQLRFRAGAGVRARVDALVAAEEQCCSFLRMRVSDEPDVVLLSIDAPQGAEDVLAGLVGAFGGETHRSRAS